MTDIIDKAAMALSAGLMLLGIVGMGILEVLVGAPYGPVPLTNERGGRRDRDPAVLGAAPRTGSCWPASRYSGCTRPTRS